jgi:hypothetical protein
MTTARPELEEGNVFRAPYPFVRDEYDSPEEDGIVKVKTWKPGTRFEWVGPEDTECVADAVGEIILTVVSIHKPGRFPTRVFFTRRWRDPKGREFGKTKLHICTAEKFRRLASGYAHEFQIACEEPAA